jgi:hypothetical protein
LFAIVGDHPNRGDPDLFIDAMLLLDGSRLPDVGCEVTFAGREDNDHARQALARNVSATFLLGTPGVTQRRTNRSPGCDRTS